MNTRPQPYARTGGVLFAALLFIHGGDHMQAFDHRQFDAHAYGTNLGLVFYAFHYLVLGCLIYRSAYLPRFLGVLFLLAAACLLVSSFAKFPAPDFAALIFPAIDIPAGIADLSLGLWLLVKGVDLPKWREQARPQIV